MRKMKLLAISTLTSIAFIMALTLAACGGDPAPGTGESQSERPTDQETASISQPATPTLEPLPTKPVPLTNLGTSTPEPVRPTRPRPSTTESPSTTTTSTEDVAETPGPETTTETGSETSSDTGPGTSSNLSPVDLIPENPKANDTVLLQDIYDLMDLDQFALDPSKPIEKTERLSQGGLKAPRPSKFPRHMLKNHPYLFMFPDLELLTKNTVKEKPNESLWPDVLYSPYGRLGDVIESVGAKHEGNHFVANDPITYFIYHPWFEEIYTIESPSLTGLSRSRIRIDRASAQGLTWHYEYYRYGPYWFGKSSTRGVLSDSIANMMKDAAYPTTELMPLTWQTGGLQYNLGDPGRSVVEYNWKLDEYIRTAVSRYTKDTRSIQFQSAPKIYKIPGGFHKYYITPHIEWEFVHPKLPIIKVTAQNSKVLPLTLPGTENPGPTEYSVSFVISFQNRWESLEDPNRWVKRFKEIPWGDGRGYEQFIRGDTPLGHRGIKYEETPGEWHHTDYMQHKIIGPIVLQIHESPVLEPGTYSIIPRVNHWEAPGYIATDQQILRPQKVKRDSFKEETEIVPHFDDLASGLAPNANLPLPGHVITDVFTGPGTDIWNKHEMNENEW